MRPLKPPHQKGGHLLVKGLVLEIFHRHADGFLLIPCLMGLPGLLSQMV